MLGELISAGSSLLGGLFGKKSADKANDKNIKLQKEFAQSGIQWKVADAKAAGVHPLAALGASTVSFSPSVVGDNSLGAGVSNMGQDIGRAINSTRTAEQRSSAMAQTLAAEQLKGLRLDNEGKAIQNAALASQTVRNSAVGAPFPSASGTTNTGVPGQATSKGIRLAGVPIPIDPQTSPSSATTNIFGDDPDVGGWVNMIRSWDMMPASSKLALANAVLGLGPMFQVTKHPFGKSYSKPQNYGPRVTTKSFKDTFQ